MAVFRAVENRCTVVRCANTGISCFIDPRGVVYDAVQQMTDGRMMRRNVRGTAAAPVKLCDTVPFYARHGDWFAWACLVVAGLAYGMGVLSARRERRARRNACT